MRTPPRHPSPPGLTASIALLAGALLLAALPLARDRHAFGEDGLQGGEAIGAEACARCHPSVYEAWRESSHANTLREATGATLPAAVLAGGRVEHPPGASTFLVEGEGDARRVVVETLGADGAPARFPLTHVVGERRMHMFLTRLEDGRWQVLPAMLEQGTDAFFDYTRLVFGGLDADPAAAPVVAPGDPSFWTGPVRDFGARCSRCHLSGRAVAPPTPDGGLPAFTWRALGVDCETCHGPGGDHAAHHDGLGVEDTMPSPLALPRERALALCLACHMEGEVVQGGFRVGDDVFAHVTPTLLDDASRVDPYGRPLELLYDGLPFLSSLCARLGEQTCTTCHDPHGTVHRGDLHVPPGDPGLCSGCHARQVKDVEAHAHHPAGGPGGRCTDCHMAPLVIERGHGTVTDHTLQSPRFDLPGDRVAVDACTGCHEGRRGTPPGAPRLDPETLRARYAAWWPQVAPPPPWQLVLARARADAEGQAGSLVALTVLLGDRTLPPVARASAVRLLARHPDAASEALFAAARDPDDLVRREGVAALAGLAGARADASLLAALADPRLPVRAAAARAALVGWARVRASPDLLAAVIPVLEQETEAVPEDDMRWFRLGAARELAGDRDGAIDAYLRKVALDPFAAILRDHVHGLQGD